MLLRRYSVALLPFVILPIAGQAGDWPQFRGPNSSGLTNEKQIPAEWAADKNVQWKIKIPGYGWSSPIIVGDKVFVTTSISNKQKKPTAGMGGMGGGRGGFGPGGGRPPGGPPDGPGFGGPPGGGRRGGGGGFGMGNQKPPDDVYRFEIHCLDRVTGKTLWSKLAVERKPAIATHSSNTYASETPVTDGERIYAYFGMTGLYCYDLDGKLLWNKDLGAYKMMFGFGTGSSPALAGDHVIVQCDNEEKSFMAALDKKTGNEAWRVNRDDKSSWGTPFIWKTKARTEVVACSGKKVRSYDPATGKQLWELGGMTGSCSATPVADEEMIYFGCGGPMGSSPLFAVKAGASGDITLKEGETANAGVAWYRTQAGPAIASPLLYEGLLYIPEQMGGRLSCYDAKTGKQMYKKERLPLAKGFTSSPWAHDGKVFCMDEDGQTFVLKAGPELKVIGTNKLGEMFWSSVAIADGALYLRGVEHLFCIKQ